MTAAERIAAAIAANARLKEIAAEMDVLSRERAEIKRAIYRANAGPDAERFRRRLDERDAARARAAAATAEEKRNPPHWLDEIEDRAEQRGEAS